MKNYFENIITNNQISFCLTNKPFIDEREIHSYHEILLYLEGDVELFTVNGHRKLKEPSVLMIPAENFHFLKPDKTPYFTRLKISFPVNILENAPLQEIMSEIKVIDNLSGSLKLICDKLYRILKLNEKNSAFHAYAAFLMLISELDMYNIDEDSYNPVQENGVMNSIAEYISDNLSGNLDIKSLAEIMHISPSGITHMFKKEFGIPIHKYIMQKRLVYAKKLVEKGEQLSKIYTDVGFKDYSSFYKAYLNYFGYPPSKEKKNARL